MGSSKIVVGLDPSGTTYFYQVYDVDGNEYLYSDGYSNKEEVIEELTAYFNILKENYSQVSGQIKVCDE